MKRNISVNGININIVSHANEDYISLTDIAKNLSDDIAIYSWMRNRNSVEFLGVWEQLNSSVFNMEAFKDIQSKSGLTNFNLTPKKWIEATNAVGIISKAGRGGGTYAHRDIAINFCYYLSPTFQLYIIKEFQRLKEEEAQQNQHQLQWSVRRELSKINYHLQADAVLKLLPPKLDKLSEKSALASEADLLNIALFGITAKEWRVRNTDKKGNIRDYASIEQLTVLANLENLNAYFIESGFEQDERLVLLNREAIKQMELLLRYDSTKQLQNLEDEPPLLLE